MPIHVLPNTNSLFYHFILKSMQFIHEYLAIYMAVFYPFILKSMQFILEYLAIYMAPNAYVRMNKNFLGCTDTFHLIYTLLKYLIYSKACNILLKVNFM